MWEGATNVQTLSHSLLVGDLLGLFFTLCVNTTVLQLNEDSHTPRFTHTVTQPDTLT